MTEQDFPDKNSIFSLQWSHLKSDARIIPEGPAVLSPSSKIILGDEKKDYLDIHLPGGRVLKADLKELIPPRRVENKAPAPISNRSDNFNTEVPFQSLLPASIGCIQRLRKQGEELSYRDMAEILLQVQAVRDPITVYHQRRTEAIAEGIAQTLGYTGEGLEEVRLAALLHDIGKDGVPTEVLGKNGSLDFEEKQIMDQHPLLSAAILQALNFPRLVVEAVRQHHKEPSGRGYPQVISADDVTLEGQMVRIADEADAAYNERGYPKQVKSVEEIWKEFVAGVRPRKYLPGVVRAVRETYQTRSEEWEKVQREIQPQKVLVAS